MEESINKEEAIFEQICTVNELDPQAMKDEAQNTGADASAEKLIKTALDYRAKTLINKLSVDGNIKGDGEEYKIDGDPAAPSFVINEDKIRSKYNSNQADKIIDVLGQVKLPVQP